MQGVLEEALATILRTPDPVGATVAGRTDSGVHARGQVAHADVPTAAYAVVAGRSGRTAEQAATVRLNGVLPGDVRVAAVSVAPSGFDARFSALERRYSYRLADELTRPDPVRRVDTASTRGILDVDLMNAGAAGLVGLRDFAAFCKRRDGATTVRTLLQYTWTRDANGVLVGTVRADAFCHSMVRSLVGAVLPVGLRQQSAAWPAEVLRAGAREPAVAVMPARGLCLEQVVYPADEHLRSRAEQTRVRREPI